MRAPRLFPAIEGVGATPRSYVVTRVTRFEGWLVSVSPPVVFSFSPGLVGAVPARKLRFKFCRGEKKRKEEKKKNSIIQMYLCLNILAASSRYWRWFAFLKWK